MRGRMIRASSYSLAQEKIGLPGDFLHWHRAGSGTGVAHEVSAKVTEDLVTAGMQERIVVGVPARDAQDNGDVQLTVGGIDLLQAHFHIDLGRFTDPEPGEGSLAGAAAR